MTELETLPRETDCGGLGITLRVMAPADEAAVLAFARALPAHDLLFLPRDIAEPKVLAAWMREADRGRLTTVLALHRNEVVGTAAIVRDPHSWSPHVGELRVVTATAVRGQGVGRALIETCFAIMLQSGIEKIVAQMTPDQEGAIAVFQSLGFESEGVLRQHVQDRDGNRHDLVVLGHDIQKIMGQMTAFGVASAF